MLKYFKFFCFLYMKSSSTLQSRQYEWFLSYGFFWDRVSPCSSGCIKLMMQPQCPNCWDHRHALLTILDFFFKDSFSCLWTKPSLHFLLWTFFPLISPLSPLSSKFLLIPCLLPMPWCLSQSSLIQDVLPNPPAPWECLTQASLHSAHGFL